MNSHRKNKHSIKVFAILSVITITLVSASCTNQKIISGTNLLSDSNEKLSSINANECATSTNNLEFVCGPHDPEDLISIPGTELIVVSSTTSKGAVNSAGRISLVDTTKRTEINYTLDMSGSTLPEYSSCPNVPEMSIFKPHGVTLRTGENDKHLLYVVNHGGRESVEIFTLNTQSPKVTITWAGCVILPANASGNSVATLTDGGFIVSSFFDPEQGVMFPQLKNYTQTGAAYRWHPTRGLTLLPNSKNAANNGVEVSVDGKYLFMNLWTKRQVLRYDLNNLTAKPISTKLDFMPDNIHRAPDGSMLIGGHISDILVLESCKKPSCPVDWAVARLAPDTLKVDYLLWEKGTQTFHGVTGAAQVGDKLWISTYHGDKVAVVVVPPEAL